MSHKLASKGLWAHQGQRVLIKSNLHHQTRLVSTAAAQLHQKGHGESLLSSKTKPAAPLSALPTPSLFRSLLITAISSKPYLLGPSLSILQWLCSSPQGRLWNIERNPVLRFILKTTFYKHFCAGETPEEARQTLLLMKSQGFKGTLLTYGKETVFDFETNKSHGQGDLSGIEAWRKGTMETAELLGEGDQLALKLTGAGPSVTDAFASGNLPPQPMMDALDEICSLCRGKNARVIIDAESQHYQAGIFRTGMVLADKYNRDGHALIYNTYQAYLKSTPQTLAVHLAAASEKGFTLGLKLVRGAYMASDKRSLIHDTKQDTDDAYNSISQGALTRRLGVFGDTSPFPAVDLFLASHNRDSLIAAQETHQSRLRQGLKTVPLAFAQLHGMSDALSFELIQMGGKAAREGNGESVPAVYKCSTWGTLSECLAYLMRRAAENRDAVGRTNDEYGELKRELWRRTGLVRG
ncbi:FAD-linked oxidoreductase-like protein [Plectosphaerella plurivora]|uniref:Proline dehydrogenase n=1 Tax=Plectosphaerella plurivora TaxID=936078 RepID=A0A9P8V1R6_9PEZI|nr:FAD-linked oxidoreductase-like protein [Plectosphaerella plurivora]